MLSPSDLDDFLECEHLTQLELAVVHGEIERPETDNPPVQGLCVTLEHRQVKERFGLEALDPDDPFELDSGNLPHLAKHAPFTAEDALDSWAFGNPLFYPAAEGEPADCLMVARIPGDIVVVPLAAPRSGDPRRCRPIGIYRASPASIARYEEDSRR